jgi:16S rRNA (cytosine967-C5)-methyltransferase
VDEALRICRHDQTEPPTIVRLFKGVTAVELQQPGVTLTPHEREGMLVVEPARQAVIADWSERGLAQAQDPTSAAVVPLCDIRPGQLVLDRCCGRGTKTLQLRDAMGVQGEVFAIDPSGRRIESLGESIARRQLTNVHIHQAGMLGDLAGSIPNAFDRILVDAPCSNSGVLARRPEARYAQGAGALKSIARLQQRILDDSAGFVREGGLLIYSTCSIWPEENEAIVSAFVAAQAEFELRSQHTTLPRSGDRPAEYHDGGFSAVLARR